MPQVLTEVDEFFATITVPTAGDSRNAAGVELPFQKLTNRTRNLVNRLAAAEAALTALQGLAVLGHYAHFQFAFSSVVTGTATVQNMLYQKGGYSVVSNLIYVPAPGWYRLNTFGIFNTNSTTTDPTIGILIRASNTTLRTMTATRPGTVIGDATPEVQGSVVFQIVDHLTHFIELRASGPGGATVTSSGRTEIQRLLDP